jgi:mRNA-degrading endonuclease toxin of MazEF toxin-antitoxin module
MRETMISSPHRSLPSHGTDFDVVLRLWREAGLNVSSTIRVHKLTVLAKDDIVRRLGAVSATDRVKLAEALRRAFSLDQ